MMLSLFMCETFIRLCEERTGVGLHLSLDYLRKFFFFSGQKCGCSDIKSVSCSATKHHDFCKKLSEHRELLVVLDFINVSF